MRKTIVITHTSTRDWSERITFEGIDSCQHRHEHAEQLHFLGPSFFSTKTPLKNSSHHVLIEGLFSSDEVDKCVAGIINDFNSQSVVLLQLK